MRTFPKTIVIALLVILIIGVSARGFIKGFNNGFTKSFNESFLKGYRSAFVRKCIDKDESLAKKTFCECCADESMAQLNIEQLRDIQFSIDYIKKNIVPGCKDRALAEQAA